MIKGMDMLVKIGANTVGGQRGASLEMSTDTIDATIKGGTWKEQVASLKSWTVSADGLYVASDVAYAALQTAFANGEEVAVSLTNGTITYSGQAIISSLSVDVPYDDAMTYAVSFTGNGELTVGPKA
ncbi:MAG: phage major tail protein, TP901-1 family [Paraclostridium sp.]